MYTEENYFKSNPLTETAKNHVNIIIPDTNNNDNVPILSTKYHVADG